MTYCIFNCFVFLTSLVEEAKTMTEGEGWEFVNLGEQQSFGIKTAGLEDKSTACQMLVCYARELKEAFADYTEEVAKIMVPLLKFYFHDNILLLAFTLSGYPTETVHFSVPITCTRPENFY